MRFRKLAFCAVFAALLAPVAAVACDEGHPFDQSFADSRHGASIRSGSLVLKPRKGRDAYIQESTEVTDKTGKDIEICVKMTFEHVGQAGSDSGGVAFWAADADNYYYFGMTSSGSGYIEQRIKAKSHVLVDFRPVIGANFGEGASNNIEIATVGKNAVVYVNGREFDRIVGQPPGNIEMMLLAVASSPKAPIVTFDDLDAQATTVLALGDTKVSDQAKAGGCDGVALIDDPFDSWDARFWGKTWPETTIVNSRLIFAPQPGHEFRLWTDPASGDIDICSSLAVNSDQGQSGILFWLKDDGDYNALLIGKDGKAVVEQSVGNQWTEVLGPVAIDAVAGDNRLKISLRGQRAELYVNGTDIGSVTAPPNAGRQVGLLVAMQNGVPVQGSFDDLVVSRPPVPTLMIAGSTPVKSGNLIEDRFENPADYDMGGSPQGVENGHLVQKPTKDDSVFFHVANPPRDVDLSVKITFPESLGDKAVMGGLFFWRRDLTDYYGIEISSDGFAVVFHRNGEDQENVIKDHEVPEIRTAKGAENVIRAVLVGDRAALFVNDTRIGDIAFANSTTDKLDLGLFSEADTSTALWFDDLVGKAPAADFAFQPARNDHGDPMGDAFDALDKVFDKDKPK